MREKRNPGVILLTIAAACLFMGWVDAGLQPGYAGKSLLKLGAFLVVPWLMYYRSHPEALRSMFRWNRAAAWGLLTGVGVFVLIQGGYLVLRPWLELSQVAGALEGDLGVTADNFLWVSLYISFVNSLLEEFFFRGFGFLTLRGCLPETGAVLFSAGAFALYHLAMMLGWLPLWQLAGLILALFAAGLVLNFITGRTGSLWCSWFLHMFANLSINLIGFRLLAGA